MANWQNAKVKSSIPLGFGFYKGQKIFIQVLTERILIFDGESRAKIISKEEAENAIEFGSTCNWATSDQVDKKFFAFQKESKRR